MGGALGRRRQKEPDEWDTVYEGYHRGPVTAVCFCGDGKTLITASADGTACVWTALSGAHRITLPHGSSPGHTEGLTSCACDGDGSRVITGSRDHAARIWDAVTGATIHELVGHKGHVNGVCFSADGDRVATAGGDWKAKIWSTLTGEIETVVLGHIDAVLCVAFDPKGTRLATGSGDKTVRVWDATKEFFYVKATGKSGYTNASGAIVATYDAHDDHVTSVSFARKRPWLVSSSLDKTIKIWDVTSGEEFAEFELKKGVHCAALSDDDARLVAAGADRSPRIWDVETMKLQTTLDAKHRAHRKARVVAGVAFSGEYVATASDDGLARLWEARDDSAKKFDAPPPSAPRGSPRASRLGS